MEREREIDSVERDKEIGSVERERDIVQCGERGR